MSCFHCISVFLCSFQKLKQAVSLYSCKPVCKIENYANLTSNESMSYLLNSRGYAANWKVVLGKYRENDGRSDEHESDVSRIIIHENYNDTR